MKPRRTHESTTVFRLRGGTEDNDLWTTIYESPKTDKRIIGSTWVLDAEERAAVNGGANIELLVVGDQPPVEMRITQVEIGKRPESQDV